MITTRLARRSAAALTTATLVVSGGLLAGPAQAAIVYTATVTDVLENPTVTCDRGTADPSDDFEVDDSGTVTLDYKMRQRPNGQIFYSARVEVLRTFTNLATGRSWTAVETYFEHDLKVLERIGDTAIMKTRINFRAVTYDEQGKRASADVGTDTVIYEVDDQGTPDPSDDDVNPIGDIISHGPRNAGDVCENAERFTTG